MSEATAYSLANQLQKYRESYKVMVSNVVTVCIPSAKVKLSKRNLLYFRCHDKFHSDHNPGKVAVGILPSGWEN